MPTTLGSVTRTYISAYEEDKIACEFSASVAVNKGMPVKLAADGTIVPWVKTDLQHLFLGIAQKTITAAMITIGGTGPDGPLVTVITRGYCLVYGVTTHTATTLAAGPATTPGVATTSGFTDYNQYTVATDVTDAIGWILDASASGIDKVIRILIKD